MFFIFRILKVLFALPENAEDAQTWEQMLLILTPYHFSETMEIASAGKLHIAKKLKQTGMKIAKGCERSI